MATFDPEAEELRLKAQLELVNKAIETKCKDLIEDRDRILLELQHLKVRGYRVDIPEEGHVKYGENKYFMVTEFGFAELAHKCAKEFSEKVNGKVVPIR